LTTDDDTIEEHGVVESCGSSDKAHGALGVSVVVVEGDKVRGVDYQLAPGAAAVSIAETALPVHVGAPRPSLALLCARISVEITRYLRQIASCSVMK
jgi:hypothetical protein